MINKNFIFAKEEEYKEFLYKANKDNKIRVFFRNMLKDMPEKLRGEIKHLPTSIQEYTNEVLDITGAEPFTFYTRGASETLKRYLESYIVFVEKDSEEVIKWKGQLKEQYKVYSSIR